MSEGSSGRAPGRSALLRRRGALASLAAVALASMLPARVSRGQPSVRTHRIGFLTPVSFPAREAVFRDELARLGYVDGRNVAIAYRSADGRFDRLPGLAAELVALEVDVIVAVVTEATRAARRATGTIPIVMVGTNDPVGIGLVATLGRPGGNVTGTSTRAAEVVGKQMGLLQEMLPKADRLTALWNPANNPNFQRRQLEEAHGAARRLGMQLRTVEARNGDEVERAFATLARERPDAVIVLADPVLATHAARVAELAIRHRLPTVGGSRDAGAAGLLLCYGPDYGDAYRLAPGYVDRILKGARPAELPVEQTEKFELVVNQRTARALGVTVPQALLLRADAVLE